MTTPAADELLTTKEAASYLRVHPVTLHLWQKSGKIPAERAGRRLRFRKADLDAWLRRDQPVAPQTSQPVA